MNRPRAHRPGEARGLALQAERTSAEAARESAIARRASEMPKAYRPNYLRAARGKASPRMAIKAFCLECVGWQRQEVRRCTGVACPLWRYRPFVEDDE